MTNNTFLTSKGWLLTRPPTQKEVIYNEFEGVFPKMYTYAMQSLEPKMEVGVNFHFFLNSIISLLGWLIRLMVL